MPHHMTPYHCMYVHVCTYISIILPLVPLITHSDANPMATLGVTASDRASIRELVK